jgi:GTP-binding protein
LSVELVRSAALPEQFPPESLPEFAFLGRSNVGKSSLLNSLIRARGWSLKKGLAFVSQKPGCTRTINFYLVQEKTLLVDLPGYGYARTSRTESEQWQALAEEYLLHRGSLKIAMILLDSRRGWMEADRMLRQWLQHHNKTYMVVATKVDKLNQSEEFKAMRAIRSEVPGDVVVEPFSAITGRGVREIWQTISKTRNPATTE